MKFLVDSLDVIPQQHRMADMAGFAAALATGEDAQTYVDGLRDAWGAILSIRRFYFDTAPLIYYTEEHPQYLPTLRVIMGQIAPIGCMR